MKKLLTKIWAFIKNDWSKTRGVKLFKVAFVAMMIAVITQSFFNFFILKQETWFLVGLWQIWYMILWMMLDMVQESNRQWRRLCKDVMKFNDELLENRNEIIKGLEDIIKKKEEEK